MMTKSKIKNIRGGKLLLKHLESSDLFEIGGIRGLCSFALHLLRYSKINDEQYTEVMKFIYENKPETPYSEAYWFRPTDKQARIDHLKQLLYGNKDEKTKG